VDDWTLILLDAEEAWSASRCIGIQYMDVQEYRYIRDVYKAHWIYEHYGYDYFLKFVERCPHVQDIIKDYSPCIKDEHNCSMFCIFYKGGCTNAAE
jgi:hypothetical protein